MIRRALRFVPFNFYRQIKDEPFIRLRWSSTSYFSTSSDRRAAINKLISSLPRHLDVTSLVASRFSTATRLRSRQSAKQKDRVSRKTMEIVAARSLGLKTDLISVWQNSFSRSALCARPLSPGMRFACRYKRGKIRLSRNARTVAGSIARWTLQDEGTCLLDYSRTDSSPVIPY